MIMAATLSAVAITERRVMKPEKERFPWNTSLRAIKPGKCKNVNLGVNINRNRHYTCLINSISNYCRG